MDFNLRSSRIPNANFIDLAIEVLASWIVAATANAKLVSSCQGQGARDSNLNGIDIPVRITGTFANPRYEPQLGGVINALTQNRSQPARTTTRPSSGGISQPAAAPQKPEDALKGIIQGGLKGLFGN